MFKWLNNFLHETVDVETGKVIKEKKDIMSLKILKNRIVMKEKKIKDQKIVSVKKVKFSNLGELLKENQEEMKI